MLYEFMSAMSIEVEKYLGLTDRYCLLKKFIHKACMVSLNGLYLPFIFI